MRTFAIVLMGLLVLALRASAAGPPPTAPTLDEVRKEMGIPSNDTVRGQKDAVGFASTAAQMAEVWELSALGPAADRLGDAPTEPVWGVLCPHDDYLYAGRVYRAVLPLVKAKRVIVVGVFHGWRKFDCRDILVFDPYRAWRTPDGEVAISSLRETLLAGFPQAGAVQSAAMNDSEHSVEAIVYWLKHQNPGVEIVPILVPAMDFGRMETLASRLGQALGAAMKEKGWVMGHDVGVAISSDAVHYGPDFKFTPHGEGGIEAYTKACAVDRALLTGPLSGAITPAKARQAFETFCDPKDPGQYRLTWCGRFSVPFGLLLLEQLASAQGKNLIGSPLAYATSAGSPQLPAQTPGLGVTAPSNLYHFVGYPAAAYIAVPKP